MGKIKVPKKVSNRVFPKVQVSFSDFSKVPKKFGPNTKVRRFHGKFPKYFKKMFGKSAKHFFQTISGTIFGTFCGTFELWCLVRTFLALWKNQKMELELSEKPDSELSSELLFFSILGLL